MYSRKVNVKTDILNVINLSNQLWRFLRSHSATGANTCCIVLKVLPGVEDSQEFTQSSSALSNNGSSDVSIFTITDMLFYTSTGLDDQGWMVGTLSTSDWISAATQDAVAEVGFQNKKL